MRKLEKRESLLLAGLFLIFFSGAISPRLLFAYEVISVKEGGQLSGTIQFAGEIPSNPSHPDLINPDYCGSIVQEETFLINPANRGLKNVVVAIQNVPQGKPPVLNSIIIETRKCKILPHVQATMAGDSFEVRTADPILHNMHLSMDTVSLLNVAMLPGGKPVQRPISQSGLIKVKCDTHKFMQGWVSVEENPYFAVTDKEGAFSIKDIPPGNYSVKIWHEGLPSQVDKITILPGDTTKLSLELSR